MELQMETIHITKKRTSPVSFIKKVSCITWAIIGWIVSFCLLFTLIGIPFALLIGMGSFAIFAAAFDKSPATCPHCKKKTFVGNHQEDFTCKRCKKTTLIDWTK